MTRTVGIMPLSMAASAPAPAVAAAADGWRDAEISRLGAMVDQLTGPPVCLGTELLQRTKLLAAIRKEGTRRRGLLRAKLQRAAARRVPTPDVEMWGGKLVIGAMRSLPSGLICSLED